MPICTVCPGCAAIADVPDNLRGTQIRCTNCQTVFVVGQATPWSPPVAKPPQPEPAAPEVVPVFNPEAVAEQPVQHDPRDVNEDLLSHRERRTFRDDDDYPWPRKRDKSAKGAQVPVGLIVGGVLGVVLIVAGIIMLVIGLSSSHSG
ncbi:MAG TPA: hypothetical protein VG013_26945 [Gemmataceae bacterium]|jgi:hypothetical protein|nr:hypothetical protein [Gemmataceae bacterium]